MYSAGHKKGPVFTSALPAVAADVQNLAFPPPPPSDVNSPLFLAATVSRCVLTPRKDRNRFFFFF